MCRSLSLSKGSPGRATSVNGEVRSVHVGRASHVNSA